jgi:uncharacterized membrane protein YeaQ/YmgE (transglycosylase-associated protein family)
MHLIWSVLTGLVVGLIAHTITRGRDPGDLSITAALGMGGALASTYAGDALGVYQAGESVELIGAVIGAALLLVAHQLAAHR